MIETTAIIILLVTAAKAIEIVTSAADRGAYKISTIFPWILAIINPDDEWENDCCITCIAISPGAKKLMNGIPSTLPLASPIAKESTNKKRSAEISGEKIVCIQTFKNLKTSFLYNAQAPIQLTKPNLLVPILYFVLISTMASLITLNFKKSVQNYILC